MFEVWNNVWNFAHNSNSHFYIYSTLNRLHTTYFKINEKSYTTTYCNIFIFFSQNVLSFSNWPRYTIFHYLYRCHSLKSILLHLVIFCLWIHISDGVRWSAHFESSSNISKDWQKMKKFSLNFYLKKGTSNTQNPCFHITQFPFTIFKI